MLALANKLSITTQPVYKFVNKYSIDFDGVDDRIITDGADTVLQNTTYSFWCKSSTTGVNNGVFGHGLDRTGAFHFNRNADRPQLFLGTNYYVFWNDNSAQDDGEWHHWVVYSDSNDITNSKLYVDGVLQSQSFVTSSGSPNAYTESLTIGSDQASGGNSFEGQIDEFAVYDRELTQAEITKIYNDGSPINLNLNAGDYQSANPLITSTKSMEFDGVDDYLEVGDIGSQKSMSFWFNPDNDITASSNFQRMFGFSTTYYGISTGGSTGSLTGETLTVLPDGASRTATTKEFDANRWYHIVIAWNETASYFDIYVDGVLSTDLNTGTHTLANWTNFRIGHANDTTQEFDGKITETGVWDRTLTALEVASLYNQGVPTDLLVSRGDYSATGLQGYWKMGDGTNDEYPVIYDQVDPTLGSEEIVNGDFSSSDISMISGAGTRSVVNNELKIEESGAGFSQVIYNGILDTSKIYKATFDITFGTGSYNIYDTTQGNPTLSSSGTYTYYLTNTARFYIGSNGAGDVWYMDNISIKEVNGNPATMTNMVEGNITNQYPLTKIRNYYRMGDGILDGYPIIQDQTSPNLAHIPTTNLVTYSEDTSQWTDSGITYSVDYIISPDGTLNASKAIINDTITSSNTRPMTSVAVTSGKNYVFSVFGKADEFDMINLDFSNTAFSTVSVVYNLTNGTVTSFAGSPVSQGVEDYGNGWYRCYVVATAIATTTTALIIRLDDNPTGDGTSGLYLWGAQFEEQNQATAYIKSDGIAAVRKSSTTNEFLYSEDFSQSSWNKSGMTVTSNTSLNPLGISGCFQITESSGSGANLYDNNSNLTTGNLYTVSFYVKSNGQSRDTFRLRIGSNESPVMTATTEWVRYSYTATANSAVWGIRTNGSDLLDVLIWGAQAEQQTQAETYAKTTGLPVTIDLFTENNYGTMTNMSASDIVEDTP